MYFIKWLLVLLLGLGHSSVCAVRSGYPGHPLFVCLPVDILPKPRWDDSHRLHTHVWHHPHLRRQLYIRTTGKVFFYINIFINANLCKFTGNVKIMIVSATYISPLCN